MKTLKILLAFSLLSNVVMLSLVLGKGRSEQQGERLIETSLHGSTPSAHPSKGFPMATRSVSPSTMPEQEAPGFPEFGWLIPSLRNDLKAKLSATESMLETARANASVFATAADYEEIAALERQRLSIIRAVLGEVDFTKYMLDHTGIGKRLRQLTAAIRLTDREMGQLLNAASDGVSLDEDKALNWIEENRGVDAAITLDFRADPRWDRIEGFWQRYGIQGDTEKALNCLRTIAAADASESEKQTAEQALKAMIPLQQWEVFEASFHIQEANQ